MPRPTRSPASPLALSAKAARLLLLLGAPVVLLLGFAINKWQVHPYFWRAHLDKQHYIWNAVSVCHCAESSLHRLRGREYTSQQGNQSPQLSSSSDI